MMSDHEQTSEPVSDLSELSEELSNRYNAPEPEVWGFIAMRHAHGDSEGQIRMRVGQEYGEECPNCQGFGHPVGTDRTCRYCDGHGYSPARGDGDGA